MIERIFDNPFHRLSLSLLIHLLLQECTANEERQLLEKVAEMIASSNARKKKLVPVAFELANFPVLSSINPNMHLLR